MAQPSSTDKNRWLVESDGKRYGPYTYSELKTLVSNHQIKGTDKVNSMDLSIGWVTVTEFFRGPPPGDHEVDPAISLFDALQVAKQRAAQRRLDQSPEFAEDFVVTSKPHPSTQLWFKVIGALLFLILLVEVVKLFPQKIADTNLANTKSTTPTVVENADLKSTAPAKPVAPPPPKAPQNNTQVQAARNAAAEKEKRDREDRERRAREAREDQEREERERAEREQDEREREEAINGREAREGDFEGEEATADEADPGALKKGGARHPTSPQNHEGPPRVEGEPLPSE